MTTGSASAPRIDAHHHVWDLAVTPQPWVDPRSMAAIARSFDVGELAPQAAEAGVVATVVVQTVPVPQETPLLLRMAAEEPLVTAVVGWVDLSSADVAADLDRLRASPGGSALRGVRHPVHDEPDPQWLDDPRVRRGLAAVADAGLAFDLLVRPPQLEAATRLAAGLPELRLVLDHLGKPPVGSGGLEPWASLVRALAAHPNVSAKVSGLVSEAAPGWTVAQLRPLVQVAIDAFGPQRLMFGSDWPVCLLTSTYAQWTAAFEELVADLSPGERDDVRRGTASRAYRLG